MFSRKTISDGDWTLRVRASWGNKNLQFSKTLDVSMFQNEFLIVCGFAALLQNISQSKAVSTHKFSKFCCREF